MSDSTAFSMSLDDDQEPELTKKTTPGGSEPVRWEVVARMPGIAPATVVAGRLQSEGIPVRVWQEGAGQAIGLVVGILGTGYVAVPEAYVDQALDILEADNDFDEEWDEEDWEDDWEDEEE